MIWHRAFLWRELKAGGISLILLGLCVLLATVAVATVSGWRSSVEGALDDENRKTAGGDVVAFSTQPFSEALLGAVEPYRHIYTNELFTVALAPDSDRTLFSKLKSVEPGYPFFGAIEVRSGRPFHEALQEGFVVEDRVLERLEAEVGEPLTVGRLTLPISDVYLAEPDRPMGMFGVSPRVFVSAQQLEQTALVRPDSYIERRVHLRLEAPEEEIERVVRELQEVALPDQERVESWRHPPVSLERFVNNFFTFLDMAAAVTLVLGGLGMQSTLGSWLASRRQTTALVKTLGAAPSFAVRHYGLIVALVAGLGMLAGLVCSGLILSESGELLASVLPVRVEPELTFAAGLRSVLLGTGVVAAFTLWPLREAYRVKPALVLRQEATAPQRRAVLLLAAAMAALLWSLLWGMTGRPDRALYATVALLLLFAVCAVTGWGAVRVLGGLRPRSLALRTALTRWRPPFGGVWLVIFMLASCLSVLYGLTLTEQGLRQSWFRAMPSDSPNLLLLDIQTPQLERLREMMPLEMQVFDRLKLRLQSIDGELIDRSQRRQHYWSNDGRREMDASPATELPSNDRLVEGAQLFDDSGEPQVSLRDNIAERLGLELGQTLTFSLQGVPVDVRLASVRHSRREGFQPRVDALFPPEVLAGAPRTHFATARVDEARIGALQAELAREFPSIVSMDLGLTIRLIGERLLQMVGLVRYFLALGLACGVVVLLSAIWSNRWQYRRDAAYLKVLGTRRRFLLAVVLWENWLLGAVAAAVAWGVGRLAVWGTAIWLFQMDVPPLGWTDLAMLLSPGLITALVGLSLAGPVLQAKPLDYLRDST